MTPVLSGNGVGDFFRLPLAAADPQPVGGRLGNFSRFWWEITADSWVLSTIALGYSLEFTNSPPSGMVFRSTPPPCDKLKFWRRLQHCYTKEPSHWCIRTSYPPASFRLFPRTQKRPGKMATNNQPETAQQVHQAKGVLNGDSEHGPTLSTYSVLGHLNRSTDALPQRSKFCHFSHPRGHDTSRVPHQLRQVGPRSITTADLPGGSSRSSQRCCDSVTGTHPKSAIMCPFVPALQGSSGAGLAPLPSQIYGQPRQPCSLVSTANAATSTSSPVSVSPQDRSDFYLDEEYHKVLVVLQRCLLGGHLPGDLLEISFHLH
ncbi:uncharacterized protein LOC110990598 [Acanthaster planci]|uniref:Uncharacterized protein LOC110990598 n=1 Tax=Acanthaster planci TaxID=133434 RepID=A0A8B8A0T5_ACAPL|nr:uncharacterized protein LOC110990598 [Acanthaster planci]